MSRWDPYAVLTASLVALLAVVVIGIAAYACWADYHKACSVRCRCPCPQAER